MLLWEGGFFLQEIDSQTAGLGNVYATVVETCRSRCKSQASNPPACKNSLVVTANGYVGARDLNVPHFADIFFGCRYRDAKRSSIPAGDGLQGGQLNGGVGTAAVDQARASVSILRQLLHRL